MYHRYAPKPDRRQAGLPAPRLKPPLNHNSQEPVSRNNTYKKDNPKPEKAQKKEKLKLSPNSLLGFIPPSLYNPESKKVLGMFSAEDILLAALIFLLLENDENNDPMLVYALLYILISDYIDLPF